MNTVLKKAALAAAIMSAPFAASAANLVGGGASLPAVAYVGDGFTVPDPQARLSSSVLFAGINPGTGMPYNQVTVDGASIFGVYNQGANNASYCQTGSGTGKRVLLGAPNNGGTWSADGACGDYSATPLGFSAQSGQEIPDFAGSDSPLTADDIATFNGGTRDTARTNLVQVPALGAYIGLPLQMDGGFVKPDLSEDDVCGIFSGEYQSWADLSGNYANQPINVVYREDGSGTVFAFTQYLANTCNGRTLNNNVTLSSDFFLTSENYVEALNTLLPGEDPSDLYAVATPAEGNGGIIAEVQANTWSIGFANYSNIDAENTPNEILGYATINDNDPSDDASISVAPSDILLDTVLGDPGANGLPSTQSLASAGGTEVGCLAVVNPAIQLTQSYPIVAFTNLLTYTNNNPNAAAVEDLFEAVSDASSLPAGYAAVDAAAIDTVISTCIN